MRTARIRDLDVGQELCSAVVTVSLTRKRGKLENGVPAYRLRGISFAPYLAADVEHGIQAAHVRRSDLKTTRDRRRDEHAVYDVVHFGVSEVLDVIARPSVGIQIFRTRLAA